MGSPTIPIDPHGDLTLVVGADDDAQSFLVSSKILSVASPVWRAMLSNRNGFVEAGSEEVVFPDDNPEALSIVFLVSHLRFQEVPRKVEFQQLIDLCTVCDKYDCMSLLGPWFSTWTTPWLKHVGENGYEGWAFIAWVAGDVDVFKRTTDDIVLKCTTNKLGQCLTEDGGEVLDQSLTHHGLADAILEARNKTLTRLIEACHMMINRYVSNTHLLCKTYTHEEECDTLVFGSLVKPLQTMHLWPGDPSQIASSIPGKNVEYILWKIEQIQCYTYQETNKRTNLHSECGFTDELNDITSRIVKGKAEGVLEVNRKHLEVQQAKLKPLSAALVLE